MPKLIVCNPENNLANRLITIISAWRIARLYGLDFLLVWNTDKDKSCIFNLCYRDLFEVHDFDVSTELPASCRLIRPKYELAGGRSILPEQLVYSQDADAILIDGWRHFIYSDHDRNKTSEQITQEFRELGLKLIQPCRYVMDFSHLIGRKIDETFDCGIHYRSGALVLADGPSLAGCSVSQMISLVHSPGLRGRFNSVFVTGSDAMANLNIGQSLSTAFSVTRISTAYDFRPSNFAHWLSVLDFITLSRCKVIINSGTTTYSSLAAVLGDASELITAVEPLRFVSRKPLLGSGLGL